MQRFRSYVPAGVLLPLFVLALATLGAAVMLSGAAETARPGNVAAEASPTPGTAPARSARVFVRNTLNGQPMIMWVNRIGQAIVDGERCSAIVQADVLQTVVNSTSWPWYDYSPCNLTGVPATICYGLWTLCSEEFIFNGDDVTVDIDWALDPDDGPDPPTVTARFEHAGLEQPVTLLAWWFRAGVVDCGRGDTEPVTLSSVTAWWPLKRAPACSVPGTDILVSILTEEFGELEGSFQWSGEDVTFAVDTGVLLSTPTASPSASPTTPTPAATATPSPATATPTPAALPEAGGPPGSAPRPDAVALVVFGAVTAVIAAAAISRRRT